MVTAILATTILMVSRVVFKIKIYSQCRNLFPVVSTKKHGAGHLKPSYICTFESIGKRTRMSLQEARHYPAQCYCEVGEQNQNRNNNNKK